jgi:hypothetical protein
LARGIKSRYVLAGRLVRQCPVNRA